MDKHNEESGCYDNKVSKIECVKCGCKINYNDLKMSKLDNGTYICPSCQHNNDIDKLGVEMNKV